MGAAFRFVLGNKRLDFAQRGFNLMLAFMTFFVLSMCLPLAYALAINLGGGNA